MSKTKKYKMFPSLKLYDQLGVPYVVSEGLSKGATWTGSCMMLEPDEYGDALFFHELMHWLAASVSQRKLPDFGIGRQVNADTRLYITPTSCWSLEEEYAAGRHVDSWGTRRVTPFTAMSQEKLACNALAFYEPIVGIWDWDYEPDPQEINSAAYDFQGRQGIDISSYGMHGVAYAFIREYANQEIPQKDWAVPGYDTLKAYAKKFKQAYRINGRIKGEL